MEVEEIVQEADPMDEVAEEEVDELASDDVKETVRIQRPWPEYSPASMEVFEREIDAVKETFHDEVDPFDTPKYPDYVYSRFLDSFTHRTRCYWM